MKNRNIIGDLGKICSKLSYTCSIKNRKDGLWTIYILSESLAKFYKDYLNLLKNYPEASLGPKGAKLRDFIGRINKPKIYVPGNKDKIIKLLYSKNLTVNELAKVLNMTRQGARYLVKKLIEIGKIEIKSTVKFNNYKYGLVKK